jgi:hypothetical protein
MRVKNSSCTPQRQGVDGNHPQQCHEEIGSRTGQRDPGHVALGLAQVAEVDRHRLGIAEQEGTAGGEVQQDGDEDGAEGIDVLERVQAHAPHGIGGIVAEELAA